MPVAQEKGFVEAVARGHGLADVGGKAARTHQDLHGVSGYQVQEGEDQEGQGEHHHRRPGEATQDVAQH